MLLIYEEVGKLSKTARRPLLLKLIISLELGQSLHLSRVHSLIILLQLLSLLRNPLVSGSVPPGTKVLIARGVVQHQTRGVEAKEK